VRMCTRKLAAGLTVTGLLAWVAPLLAAPVATAAPGTVRITVDGQDQKVQGTLYCAQNRNGKFSIGIDRTFGVVMTPGTPPVVDSVVFPYGSFAGMGMEFSANVPGTGNATVEKNGNSYKISGLAADAASAYKSTRPFSIDVTCPSASGVQTSPAQVSATTPVQAPSARPAVVAPPKGMDAPQQAVEAAKTAPATQIDPANPPTPPTPKDFTQQVESVIKTHNAHIDVVNGLAHPRHWDYVDYDQDQHPILYNPINEAMTFRYFYGGDYREVYVAAGSRVVLNTAVAGVFPFAAVGGDYLASGSFYGGSPPPLYQGVAVYIPAYNQTVQVGKVQPVGRDDSQPAGSQDTFMLNDSTLAWGQANNPTDGGQITVTKTQTLPGVGPTDDGKSLVDLAVASHPQGGGMTGALVGLAVVSALVLGIGLFWIWKRARQRTV
jgi:Mycobacterium 19 kDa lipoprotein antigen